MPKRPEPFDEFEDDDLPEGTEPGENEGGDEDEDICPDCLNPEWGCSCEDEEDFDDDDYDDDWDEDYEEDDECYCGDPLCSGECELEDEWEDEDED